MQRKHLHHLTAALAVVLALTVGCLAECARAEGRVTSPEVPMAVTPETAIEGANVAGPDIESTAIADQQIGTRQVISPYFHRILGLIVFAYYHEVDFTYTNTSVTSVPVDRDWAELRNGLWTFTRYGGTSSWGPLNAWYYSEKTGLFERHLLSPSGPIVQRVKATIWIRCYAGGSYQTGTRVW
jgi:hypothetical protein